MTFRQKCLAVYVPITVLTNLSQALGASSYHHSSIFHLVP